MQNAARTGKTGENIAAKYLIAKGFLILRQNYKERADEIDIIAQHKDGTLIFFEVKTLNDNYGLMPEDNLTRLKLKKIIRVCQIFVTRNPHLINDSKGWRIDLIAITLRDGEAKRISHYENIY